MLTGVKFCGLCRPVDAARAVASGARYAGVVLSPVGPRARLPDAAAAIFAAAPGAERVGVFVDEPVAGVLALARALGLQVVQLHGSESAADVAAIAGAGPWRVWKAIRPRDAAGFMSGLDAWSGVADGVLVDGGSASVSGGSGMLFPWPAVEAYRDRVRSGLELIVAGGLAPGNVGEAIDRLRPDVVDVSSGIEAEVGVKSEALMRRFVEDVRRADRRREGVDGGG